MKTSDIRHTKISLPYNLSETPALCFRGWCTCLNKPGTAWPDFYSVIAPAHNIWSQVIPWHEDDRWWCFANLSLTLMSERPMFYFSNYKCQNTYLYNGFGALLINLDNHWLKTLIGTSLPVFHLRTTDFFAKLQVILHF